MMYALTQEQARMKAAIVKLTVNDRAPTYEELRREVGLASRSGVLRLLRCLREPGHIEYLDARARSIRVVQKARGLSDRSTEELTVLRANIDTILQERSQ